MSKATLSVASGEQINLIRLAAIPDEKNPTPSRIVFCERESEARESSASATSVPVVAIDDIELGSTGMFLTLVFAADVHEGLRICPLGGNTGHIEQEEEEGEPGAASIGAP